MAIQLDGMREKCGSTSKHSIKARLTYTLMTGIFIDYTTSKEFSGEKSSKIYGRNGRLASRHHTGRNLSNSMFAPSHTVIIGPQFCVAVCGGGIVAGWNHSKML